MAPRRRLERRLCMVPTNRGEPCQNLHGSCPHHRAKRAVHDPTGAGPAGSGHTAQQQPTLRESVEAAVAEAGGSGPLLRFAMQPHTGPLWPGVRNSGGPRLCDNATDFQSVLNQTSSQFPGTPASIVRDYHMCRTLRALFVQHPPGHLIDVDARPRHLIDTHAFL